MNHGSLFSGIGGFDLAAEWMGWNNIFHCEIEPFPRKILNHHFPNSITYEDIKQTDFSIHRGQIDILTGGFPCQPYSAAGQRKGKEDERHLWPEMLRVIREIQPRWVVGENVLGLVNWSEGLVFEEVQLDLEAEGYEVQAFVLPASAKNAPHRRDRVWFVAYSNSNGYITSFRGGDGEKEKISREHRQENSTTGKFVRTNKCNVADTIIDGGQKSPRNVGQKSGAESERGNKFTDGINYDGSQRNVTDTDSTRRPKNSKSGLEQNEENTKQSQCLHNSINVTDTDSQRQEWERKQGVITEERERGNKRFEQLGYNEHQWEKFPTQSPICGGDDGISSKLDGITFPKWRRESIKGYGNAIVPQVVFEIFKTIEEWERIYL